MSEPVPRRRTRLLRALTSVDAIAAVGIACLAFGAWLAWPPLGFLSLGVVLIAVARTEAK
jgi:hypothetical protein